MKRFTNILTAALLLLAMSFSMQATAQSKLMKKEVKKIVKKLTLEQQEAVIKYANMGLSGKEEGVAITNLKTLKKYFAMLPPKHQGQVLELAKIHRDGKERLAAATEKKPRIIHAPMEPKQIDLDAKPGTMIEKKPVQQVQPAHIVKAESMPQTTVQWYEEVHDFGKIKQGEVATHTFRFKNTGDNPLLLTRVKPSCGCTTPEWSREPVAPGAEGLIKINFNTRGKSGSQVKSIVVTHNGQPVHKVLRFKGQITLPTTTPAGGAGGK